MIDEKSLGSILWKQYSVLIHILAEYRIYSSELILNTVFTHLILSSQRGALIRERRSYEGGAH